MGIYDGLLRVYRNLRLMHMNLRLVHMNLHLVHMNLRLVHMNALCFCSNVLVLRDAFSIGLWPLKDFGLCSIGVDGTWGKAVQSESPSQAMALS